MEDVQNIGGTPGMIKFLIDNEMFDGDQMTVTGKTHKQNLEDMNHPGLTPGQEIIRPLSDPIKATGHLQIMYGNLCPGGGVAKITGKEGETFTVSRHRKINLPVATYCYSTDFNCSARAQLECMIMSSS
jgi:dihydroxy-acid dehydratase